MFFCNCWMTKICPAVPVSKMGCKKLPLGSTICSRIRCEDGQLNIKILYPTHKALRSPTIANQILKKKSKLLSSHIVILHFYVVTWLLNSSKKTIFIVLLANTFESILWRVDMHHWILDLTEFITSNPVLQSNIALYMTFFGYTEKLEGKKS